ncbi:hypothetical protein AgCh_021524 [Apium graveolens]
MTSTIPTEVKLVNSFKLACIMLPPNMIGKNLGCKKRPLLVRTVLNRSPVYEELKPIGNIIPRKSGTKRRIKVKDFQSFRNDEDSMYTCYKKISVYWH